MMIKTTYRLYCFVIIILFSNVIAGFNTNASTSLQSIHQQMNYRHTLYVGGAGPNNYSKIQDAVDNTSNGDTIFVYQGTYSEHVLITKNITVIGESRDHTIIDGGGTGNVVKIQANGAKLTQFSLQHGGIGVYIVHSSDVKVIHNTILNNWEGIGLLNSSECQVSRNIIAHNGFEGINPVETTFTIISDNSIFDHLQGIYLVESTQNLIFGNILSGNSRGIDVQESSNNNNIFHNNFFGNEQDNAYDTCSNSWDDGYPSGGNHWDDYNGIDANQDGIGDTPYNIPGGGNKDYYPLMLPWDHPPFQPSNPLPDDGAINIPINPVLSVFVFDADQDSMTVSFYEASTQQLIGIDVNVASSTRASVSWNALENNKTYQWYAIADDGTSSNQSTTWMFTTGYGTNQPPMIPTITGPAKGKIKISIEYNFTTTDSDGDNLSYYIDWGDDTNSGWIGPYVSGDLITQLHTWTKKGDYTIKAKAKDSHGLESDWGTLTVTMPYSINLPFMHFWERVFQRFPNAFPLLRQLMEY